MQKEKKTTTITNKCTGCNKYKIKPICSSTSSLDIFSSAIAIIAALLHTLTVSVIHVGQKSFGQNTYSHTKTAKKLHWQ